jgi:DNA-binding response OmpR family regulator
MRSKTSHSSTVLVLDDNRFTHELLAIELSAAFDVLSAFDPEEARAIAGSKEVAALVVNMTLPGLEAASLLQPLLGSDLGMPIIVLGVDCDSDERRYLMRLGVRDVINHPASLSEVIARVSLAIMTRRRSRLSVITDMMRHDRLREAADVAWYELPSAMIAADSAA